MTTVTSISESELARIEQEIDELYMENVDINAIQLKAIIARLRGAERARDIAMPYMQSAADRTNARRVHEAWDSARAGALLLGVIAGVVVTAGLFYFLTPLEDWLYTGRTWLFLATVSTGFMLPFCVVTLPLLRKIERAVAKQLEKSDGQASEY